MTARLSRRRFISVSAALAVLPSSTLATAPAARWRGSALGAKASMSLVGVEETAATDVFTAVQAEVARLERIFSLYRPDSALVRLNTKGHLESPPPELLELISLSDSLHRSTEGAFDPTVQPLWQLYAARASKGETPSAREIGEVRRRTGWTALRYDSKAVSFTREGMALTFNGIAQGYIADKVADLLRARGLSNVLVEMGEICALGRNAHGNAWRAGVATPDNRIIRRLSLENRALATSAPRGTLLDAGNTVGHILDPRSGGLARTWAVVSVSAERAAMADGLSTAFCLLPRAAIERVLPLYASASLEVLASSENNGRDDR
ncbi:FAD:protein FMN transferase [Denitrobaculum tricleocarpae]|uniref:FAD:protein FMN transferase n=1 Tax=Denitrobaculum tricleocarpae TaxID=2591009 RepID=A0A545TMT0_9PROT|nr:FAD:protein FMN transferase [Denitrobaculum tricleocarpae]TQV78535.1 FAD:protein FMN transferase [Denitrobaculum tricleocarpae]